MSCNSRENECVENYKINETKEKEIFVQYKKVPPLDITDTLPFKDCFIIIKNDTLFYFRDKKLLEKQKLIKDTSSIFELYYFKGSKDNIVQFYGNLKDTIVIKRNYYDGVQEYFKKK